MWPSGLGSKGVKSVQYTEGLEKKEKGMLFTTHSTHFMAILLLFKDYRNNQEANLLPKTGCGLTKKLAPSTMVNGLVGTGFTSRYQLQPRVDL